MDPMPLQTRLMENARRYDPAEHTRGLLLPFKEVILLWRVKFMSYEQIAATLTSHGIKVSPTAVGVFCRKNYTKPQILRERQRQDSAPQDKAPVLPSPATPTPPSANALGKRGPKIARDDY